MGEKLTYREAARRVDRSVRAINRWRRNGMPMGWEIRDGKRVRVVELDTLLAWWRARMNAWPPHQYRLRRMRTEDDTRHAE
jgi:hypothetical protein